MRIFIAVRPSVEVVDEIHKHIESLSVSIPDVKWVEKENLHVTLRFLGEVSVADFGTIKDKISQSVRGIKPFNVSFGPFGAFPNIDKAKTLWIKAKDSGQLESIFEIIEENVKTICGASDKSFHPHLTVGRVRVAPIKFFADGPSSFGESIIDEVLIVESKLTPKGPIYTDLAVIKLG